VTLSGIVELPLGFQSRQSCNTVLHAQSICAPELTSSIVAPVIPYQ